ncbi:MAG: RnfABCDGE type electron transport complex subunit G [Lachnospiraceae bacterium]|nr:RnfABCDGE type electron transport complex subunit G [Lachnospiraceae bacterium]
MNTEIKAMLKDAAVLFVITVIAGLMLGTVYTVTKEPIAHQEALAKEAAQKEVFPDAASFEPVADFDTAAAHEVIAANYPQEDIDEVYSALDANKAVIGYVVTVTTHEGYGGDIQFSLGIQSDGTLNGMSILSIAETAGLGMRAEEVLKPQYAGKQVETFEYTKSGAAADNQIDAISGATITTNAVTNGVNAGLEYFRNALEGGNQ